MVFLLGTFPPGESAAIHLKQRSNSVGKSNKAFSRLAPFQSRFWEGLTDSASREGLRQFLHVGVDPVARDSGSGA